jgi:hypothetical protein
LKWYNKLMTTHSRLTQGRHAKLGAIPWWRLISGKTVILNCHMTYVFCYVIFQIL